MNSYPFWKVRLLELKDKLIKEKNNYHLFVHVMNLWLLFSYFIPVVLDYGIAIRIKNLPLILKLQIHLAHVFFQLQKDNVNILQYCRCVLINVCFIKSLLQKNIQLQKYV